MEPYIVIAILAGTLTFCVLGYWRYDVVAWASLLISVIIGVVPINQAFTGFSNPAVITVALVMVLTNALIQSGIVGRIVNFISPIISKSITLHVFILSAIAAVLSGFMNNVGALALLIPITLQTCYETNRSPSLFLMPVSFASLLGGLMTLIGTPPNIIIASFRQQAVGSPFAMFDYFPVGGIVTIAGIAFLVLWGWRMLPIRRKPSMSASSMFQVKNYLSEVRVLEESPIIGLGRKDLEQWIEGDIVLIGKMTDEGVLSIVKPKERFLAGDLLLIEASHDDARSLVNKAGLEMASEEPDEAALASEELGVIEAAIPQNSPLEGHSASSLKLRSRYNINALGVATLGRPYKGRIHDIRFQAGDVVLLHGKASSLRDEVIDLGFLPLSEQGIPVPPKQIAYLPILVLTIAVLLTTFQILPVQISFLGAVTVLLLTRTISALRLYNTIDFSVIVLLGALLPIGQALDTTGGSALIASSVVSSAAYLSPTMILGVLMIITVILSSMANNAATAVIMAPIAISIAHGMNISIDPLLMGVTVACSSSFLTPIAHQNNTLVMEPGGYHFRDFFKLGLPLEFIVILVAVPAIPFFWPF